MKTFFSANNNCATTPRHPTSTSCKNKCFPSFLLKCALSWLAASVWANVYKFWGCNKPSNFISASYFGTKRNQHLVISVKETFCNHHYFHSKMEAKLCLKQDSKKCSSIYFLFLASAKSSSVSSSKKPTLSGPPLCK